MSMHLNAWLMSGALAVATVASAQSPPSQPPQSPRRRGAKQSLAASPLRLLPAPQVFGGCIARKRIRVSRH